MSEYTSIHCDNCGGPLNVAGTSAGTSDCVTCPHCASSLTVRRTANAICTRKIDEVSGQVQRAESAVSQLQRRLDVDRLDRDWEVTCRRWWGYWKPADGLAERGPMLYAVIVMAIGLACICAVLSGSVGVAFGIGLFCLTTVLILVPGMTLHAGYRAALDTYVRRRKKLMRNAMPTADSCGGQP